MTQHSLSVRSVDGLAGMIAVY
ncbi:hypothetical protein COMA2_20246 [Candidatus Nitrospira nitrificans]|uniref:Uncharacterized protein n=1 Tax=Candidatus Nitrospira nitrificans TaxID=1742973 RepID=A0A0S4LES4_9BACT|nr:hypothetical protein COMA2_20246 [Candidatus Nitrospira nitrificans]